MWMILMIDKYMIINENIVIMTIINFPRNN